MGLSPRVRGNLDIGQSGRPARGSIPARAGEPPPCPGRPSRGWVYPRACGGTPLLGHLQHRVPGLSPRVRGNPLVALEGVRQPGSIPARAGEPRRQTPGSCRRRVYPRACGGTASSWSIRAWAWGLSPRVRGNPVRGRDRDGPLGSIPARAGEPRPPRCAAARSRVYPRACGGTTDAFRTDMMVAGLSPRVRGNPSCVRSQADGRGSIPARAGEPGPIHLALRSSRVYPRACGGTAPVCSGPWNWVGLSPRVRGNQGYGQHRHRFRGSIPARAGEPGTPASKPCRQRVYPRACGGTRVRSATLWPMVGLSPRVRGNRRERTRPRTYRGSIPARAGEPSRAPLCRTPGRVYPRACGGTTFVVTVTSPITGLSPRVRGNPSPSLRMPPSKGLSPRVRGEPASSRIRLDVVGVYPRACGGTSCSLRLWKWRAGLSPRVRGNRARAGPRPRCLGSIPARAGEPSCRRPAR